MSAFRRTAEWESSACVGFRQRLPTPWDDATLAAMARYKIKQERPNVVREAAAQYKVPISAQPLQAPGVYHVTVTDRGRLVLPAEVREKLKIRDGDRVAVCLEEDGTIEIETLDVAIGKMRGMFKHLNKPGQLASDRLIAERRRQARMEDREFRERRALHRRMKRARTKRS